MSNTAGIYIKVGDDSIGDYRTFYLGNGGPENRGIWEGLMQTIIECVEGLTTYHEERQQTSLPGMTAEDMESRKAQGWRFAPEIDQI